MLRDRPTGERRLVDLSLTVLYARIRAQTEAPDAESIPSHRQVEVNHGRGESGCPGVIAGTSFGGAVAPRAAPAMAAGRPGQRGSLCGGLSGPAIRYRR